MRSRPSRGARTGKVCRIARLTGLGSCHQGHASRSRFGDPGTRRGSEKDTVVGGNRLQAPILFRSAQGSARRGIDGHMPNSPAHQ